MMRSAIVLAGLSGLLAACGGLSSAPTLAEVQAAFSAHLEGQHGAAQALDPKIAGAKGYALRQVTVHQFVADPRQHPGEPGWTAQIVASGSYTLITSSATFAAGRVAQEALTLPPVFGDPRQIVDGSNPPPDSTARPSSATAPPAVDPADPGQATTIMFRRTFPIRLERDGTGWRIP